MAANERGRQRDLKEWEMGRRETVGKKPFGNGDTAKGEESLSALNTKV